MPSARFAHVSIKQPRGERAPDLSDRYIGNPGSAVSSGRVGMKAQVMPENGGKYPAEVKVVDRVFDSASGTYGVRLELPNPKGALPGGMRCQVAFPQLGAAEVLPVRTTR